MSHVSRFGSRGKGVSSSYRLYDRPEPGSKRAQFKPHTASRASQGLDLIYGVQSVTGALASRKRSLYTLWMKTDHSKAIDREKKMDKIIELYRDATGQLPLERTTDELSSLVSGQPHQGVVLEVSNLEPPMLDELTEKHATSSKNRKNALWVALDEIQDTHNMGAIIRTCVFFGVDGIVTTEHRSAPLNSTVSKTSAGALEIAPIYHPGNLARFLEGSKGNGFRIVGTALEDNPRSASESIDIKDLEMDKPTILVLGNEAKGMREKVKSVCDVNVQIAPVGDIGEVSSLNVSVATAVLLHPLATSLSNRKEPL